MDHGHTNSWNCCDCDQEHGKYSQTCNGGHHNRIEGCKQAFGMVGSTALVSCHLLQYLDPGDHS
jgi:hypothetical protein